MAKARTQYVCQQCGYSQVGWAGKCPNCGAWSSMVETLMSDSGDGKPGKSVAVKEAISLSAVSTNKVQRISTGVSELDRALGGGLVSGQVNLIAGEPGIGKSTLLLQVSDNMPSAFYASAEESINQIKIRADRLGIRSQNIAILEETNIDVILASINALIIKNTAPSVIILDSIQTMFTPDLSGMAGSPGQVRECTYRIVRFAKQNRIPTFIVGHVTKEGTVAGPALLAHLVDTVLWFEGDKSLALRLVRAIKNRFGPTDEVGIFQMEEKGLVPITDTSRIFLSGLTENVAGSVTALVMEGTRPVPVEIQSLVVATKMAFPRRVAQGFDAKRLEVILAVLMRRCGLNLNDYDVFVNIVGGISVKEPGADLPVALSLASAYFDKSMPGKTLAVGEVGLLGEIRPVFAQERRIKEAKRLGYASLVSSQKYDFLVKAVKSFFTS